MSMQVDQLEAIRKIATLTLNGSSVWIAEDWKTASLVLAKGCEALIRRDEGVKPKINTTLSDGSMHANCGVCGTGSMYVPKANIVHNYCRGCGTRLKWPKET